MQRVPADPPFSFLIFSSSSSIPSSAAKKQAATPDGPDRTFIASPRLVTFVDCSAASLSVSVRSIALAYGLKAGFVIRGCGLGYLKRILVIGDTAWQELSFRG